jgi:hypothetical protein
MYALTSHDVMVVSGAGELPSSCSPGSIGGGAISGGVGGALGGAVSGGPLGAVGGAIAGAALGAAGALIGCAIDIKIESGKQPSTETSKQ